MLLLSNKRHVADYIYIVFFIFYVLPIFLEEFVERPDYSLFFKKLDVITSDFTTTLIYNVLMIFFQIVLFRSFRKRKNMNIEVTKVHLNTFFTFLLYLIIFLPVILTLLFDEREAFLIYGGISSRGIEDQDFYMNIVNSTNLSVLGIGFVSINNNYSIKKILSYLPILLFNIWVNGKRNAIVLILLVVCYILINNKTLLIQAKVLFILVLTTVFLFFSQYYMDNIKGFENEQTSDEKYATFRIDYGRDHDLKMAIFHEVSDQYPPILEYRGQSMLFILTIFVPRSIWPEKPLTYTAYFTSALLEVPPDFQNFGMTSGIFDEFIANFTLLGFFISVWILIKLIRKSEKINNTFFYLVTLLTIALLLSNDIKSYIPIFVIWFLLNRYLLKVNKKIAFKDSRLVQ